MSQVGLALDYCDVRRLQYYIAICFLPNSYPNQSRYIANTLIYTSYIYKTVTFRQIHSPTKRLPGTTKTTIAREQNTLQSEYKTWCKSQTPYQKLINQPRHPDNSQPQKTPTRGTIKRARRGQENASEHEYKPW